MSLNMKPYLERFITQVFKVNKVSLPSYKFNVEPIPFKWSTCKTEDALMNF